MAVTLIVRNVIATSPRSSVAAGRQVERTVAEVRVRVGVEHDREVAVGDLERVVPVGVPLTVKCGCVAVVVTAATCAAPRR